MKKSFLNKFRDFLTDYLIVTLRYYYWKLFFNKIGKNVKFRGSIKVLRPYNISVGDNCGFNDYVLLNARTQILIGNNVVISPGVIINTGGLYYKSKYKKKHFSKKVIIKDGVWLGSNSLIMPGVTIGKNTVIGGGAVVVNNIPANSVAVGVPAKVVKKLNKPSSSK